MIPAGNHFRKYHVLCAAAHGKNQSPQKFYKVARRCSCLPAEVDQPLGSILVQ